MPPTPQQIKEQLLKAIDKDANVVDMAGVVEVVSVLESAPASITKEALEETRLGKLVNDIRKKSTNDDLSKRCRRLLRQWQKLCIPQQANANKLPRSASSSSLNGSNISSSKTEGNKQPDVRSSTSQALAKTNSANRRKRRADEFGESSHGAASAKRFAEGLHKSASAVDFVNGLPSDYKDAAGNFSRNVTKSKPGTPNLSSARLKPGTPNLPSARLKPGTPNLPSARLKPGTPNLPSARLKPGTPNLPSARLNPGTPNLPSTRLKPGTPNLPSVRLKPGTPNVPSARTKPGSQNFQIDKSKSSPVVTDLPGSKPGTPVIPSTKSGSPKSRKELSPRLPHAKLGAVTTTPSKTSQIIKSQSAPVLSSQLVENEQSHVFSAVASIADESSESKDVVLPSHASESSPTINVDQPTSETLHIHSASEGLVLEKSIKKSLEIYSETRNIPETLENEDDVERDKVLEEVTQEEEEELPRKPATEAEIDKLHSEHWEGVNGCHDSKGEWHSWNECMVINTCEENSIHILPYVVLD
ncbi:uncharacterized protein LOC100368757 [Saccoglossus kowalevskii]|uniref:Mediator of RNA polymerase II transcription subunit 26 n=1 Tax=Saccoglossus kowalevskii TaxID=10224 RepID=A0ABM0GZQ4_SACKO|nr:PREDICTED: mediator of RNA polymerase II transcription subunit 26-like [Saccoglossus kowalevskii]